MADKQTHGREDNKLQIKYFTAILNAFEKTEEDLKIGKKDAEGIHGELRKLRNMVFDSVSADEKEQQEYEEKRRKKDKGE
jgi:hypothetical protein